ncbi:TIGR03085 family metal-binding protein [Actinoplanes sp. NPDC051411]|uniref:TIGR03085 family metal-binding protein n=1 Tax=Actinoplanes sp. NPDC051411 TaxID=3155522 RepID=UPI0034148350
MTDFARRERLALAQLLADLGPDQPTLCTGWTTGDLAAHLVIRDRRPDAAAGAMISALAGHGERVRLAQRGRPYPATLDKLRTPPWWSPLSHRPLEALANGGEFFIHHEDVRRARADWEPRDLAAEDAALLWGQARFRARMALGRLDAPITVRADGFGEVALKGDETVLSGAPGELILFLAGRKDAARVEISGPAAEKIRAADLSL